MTDLAPAVRESLSPETRRTFERRVEEQAAALADDIAAGRLDNQDFAVGLELEAYAVDDRGRIAPVPEAAFEAPGCGKELGVHNVEVHTDPDVLDATGLDRQAVQLRRRVDRAREVLTDAERRLVLDATWTIPPAVGTETYLAARENRDGVVVAENMRRDARYCALDNDTRRVAGGDIRLSVPGVDRTFPSILFESLTTSMQPHLQVPEATAVPRYFNYALRTLGPVLALTANSPFLPADLYDDPAPSIAEATHHELRIAVFEQSINVDDRRKVRLPPDLDRVGEVVDRLVADETVAPFLSDEGDPEYPDRYPELEHKRGTYWRWVRTVIGGGVPTARGDDDRRNDAASIRLEYRPLPTQPTVRDTVAAQALVVGLLRGLVAADHPLADLPWEAAEASFYAAAEDGLDANLAWVTAAGERTADPTAIYPDLFEHARLGLTEFGTSDERIDELLAPLERRWDARTTPSAWKKVRVRESMDAGDPFREAVVGMQREYIRRASGAAENETFADWLDEGG